ncbi:MAG: hypothetical protein CMK23_10205 [Porticoccaceae bacterium]|jgi:hypothetical protein|nr:hypothetical protein [Porticoccaceae bacterium]|tara:strand:+ start:355 stop:906 length:552 start_codon:yes stop_codon:yes gene_type:complete
MIKVIHDFLDRDYCKAFTLYALNERLENFKPYSRNPKETPGPKTHGRHSDPFAQASLKAMMPKVQRYFKQKEIYPSYSYYIVYENEARLDPHVDKDACEISVTVPTGYLYGDSDKRDLWPLYLDGKPIELDIGDAVLYTQEPKKITHWRKPFGGIYQVQLLFHYVTGGNYKTPVPLKKLVDTA